MDTDRKLELLGSLAVYDVSAPGAGNPAELVRGRPGCIFYAEAEGGRCLPVLKVLLTNECRNNCHYCAVRARADIERASFKPEELARIFVQMHSAGLVEGIFLSSGVADEPDVVQEKIVDTARIIREKYGFQGYVHLKVLPGASEAAIEETIRLASRVSVNVEAPTEIRLRTIAPDKARRYRPVETLAQAARIARSLRPRSGLTTQFVAGGAGESDRELLEAAWRLYRQFGLWRAYYSAFRPVPGTPLENVPPTPEWREARLYQADWLLRFYGFSPRELVFDTSGNLPADKDPKLAWALSHPELFPVEVTAATYEQLIRVPGIGPVRARRILQARREGPLRDERDLDALGIPLRRAAPFITLRGKRVGEASGQLRLRL